MDEGHLLPAFLAVGWQEERYGRTPRRHRGFHSSRVLISPCSFQGGACPGRDLGPVAEAQLGQDVLDVVLGRPLGHEQLLGDCRFVIPRATSCATCCSRRLNGDSGSVVGGSTRRATIRWMNGAISRRPASGAVWSSSSNAWSRSPGASRRSNAAMSSTAASTRYPRAPLAAQATAADRRSSIAASSRPTAAAALPSCSSTGPMYVPTPAPLATCCPRKGSNRVAR